MAKILWAVGALDDLRDIVRYIVADSPTYAVSTAERILDAVDRLSRHPRLGRIVPEYGDESIRELIVGRYRVVYRLVAADIEVLAVTHGSRDLLRRAAEGPWDLG